MITGTDLFSGAGGSTTGAIQVPGVSVRIAANHNQIVTDIHALNHPSTDHAVVDLHLERPSFFPKTDWLWASPECKKWSQASGADMPAIEVGLFEDPLSDDAKTRSRLLMFDVLRFIEYHRYRLVFIENVVDIATQKKYATAWQVWRQELRALGYAFRVVSWRPRREVGRYRQAYTYNCRTCNRPVEPAWLAADTAIDLTLPSERIGDRLKPKTRLRVAHGIARYWAPIALEAAGNTYDAADPAHLNFGGLDAYYRAWPLDEPLRSLHTTSSKALAVPLEAREGKEAYEVSLPFRTQTARAEQGLAQRPPFMAELYGTSTTRPLTDPAGTFTAGGNHHALVQAYYGTTLEGKPVSDPLGTLTTRDRYALLQRLNSGGAEMTTPLWEEMRTLTTGGNVAVLEQPEKRRRVTPADLAEAMEMVPEVLFRMLVPSEVAAGMAFPADYKWQPPDRNKPVSNRDLVAAAGNAVTPPSSRDVVGVSMTELGVELDRVA